MATSVAALLCGAMAVATPAWAASATAATVYVSPSGSDATGAGTTAAPFQSIQKALSVVPAGGVIVLEPGTYRTMVTITTAVSLESDVSVTGAAAKTILDASGQPHAIVIKGAAAAGTAIRGLTAEDASDIGILIQDTHDITIAQDIVTHNATGPDLKGEHKGIQLEGVSGSAIENNSVTANALGGIRVTSDATNPANDNTVSGNTVTGNGGDCGIVVSSASPAEGASGNVITHNTVSENPVGIVLAGRLNTDNRVTDNTITANFAAGIVVHSNAPHDTVKGNVFEGNVLSGNGQGPTSAALVLGANVTPVSDTTVSNNTISHEYFGIWEARAAGTVLSGNKIDAASVTVPVYNYTGNGDMPVAAPAAKTLPKTGGNPLASWLGLLLVAAGAAVLLLTRRQSTTHR